MVEQMNHIQLNNKNGIENGNNGIEINTVKIKVIIPQIARSAPIKTNHSKKMLIAIWNIHVPAPGIIANHAEITTQINRIIYPTNQVTNSIKYPI